MRKIELAEPNTQVWKRWRRACEKATVELHADVEAGRKPSFKKRLYRRKSIKGSWFFAEDSPFYGKCAYCEAPIPGYQRGDVEHFRPKGRVTDAHGHAVDHPGYYWLAYDWQNLLPSCIICNQKSKIGDQLIGKLDRFPVEGQHAQTPADVDAERPLLIHPASGRDDDDPEIHLEINTKTGLMSPRDRSERGQTCIDIFGLNLRAQLVADRKRACREVKSLLVSIRKTPGGDPDALAELLEIQAGKRSFTMAQRTALQEAAKDLKPILDDT